MHFSWFYWLLFGFLGGVFILDMFREWWVVSGAIALGLGSALVYCIAFLKQWKNIHVVLYSVCLGIGGILGSLHVWAHIPSDQEKQSLTLFPLAEKETKAEFLMQIDSFPLSKNGRTEFYAQVYGVGKQENNSDETILQALNPPERVLVKQYGIHSWEYGEKVVVYGTIQRPGEWEKFSYNRFLEKEGVFGIIPKASVQTLQKEHQKYFPENSWNTQFWKEVFEVRQWFESQMRAKIVYPHSEYALGILLGAEAGIPSDIIQDFNDTGLRHLLALSGFNITILILFLFWIFCWVPKWLRIAITAIMIFVFVGLTGGSSSVVRAAVMGVLGLLALHSGHKTHPFRLLIIALVCITLWNPFLLYTDASLQFSVLAVLGLLFLVPLLERVIPIFQRLPEIFSQVLYATLSAQIATLPLMIVLFENVSIISPLANLLVAPLTTLSMAISFFVVIPLGGWIAVPFAYGLLALALFIAESLANLPYIVINTPGLPLWSVFPMYFMLIVGIWKWKSKQKPLV